MAQGADPERALKVADVRDRLSALRRGRNAPQFRAQPAARSAASVTDDHGCGAAGRDIIAHPRVSSRLGPGRGENGRAACRGRGGHELSASVVAVRLKKKKNKIYN